MLHNLKHISTSRTAEQCTSKLMSFIYVRPIARYGTGLIRCWQCGNENSSAGIQFKCTKCQCLLEMPDDVVRMNKQRN